ncbi:MAG: menaquinone biosynthesis protein [Candidatus Omnitrophica bacterium]|nr:menaquinone biosynthesis protein [Candidatus Omnitrophota bacterium]
MREKKVVAVKSRKRRTLKVGKICYINALPFFHGLPEGDENVNYFCDVPSVLNSELRKGNIDIALISSLEYLHRRESYYLLPGFSIGSRDFSNSVILLSREKIEGLNQKTVALPKESMSSSALLKILLASKYKLHNRFSVMPSDPSRMLAKNDAALLIGDKALFFRSEEFFYRYDLSEIWWNWTEQPFCFAVWAVRRKYADKYPEEVKSFYHKLRLNLDRNLLDIEKLTRDALGIHFLDDKFSKIFGYLFNLSYFLDPSMQQGLELFYRLAYRLKIAPHPGKLEFFPVA